MIIVKWRTKRYLVQDLKKSWFYLLETCYLIKIQSIAQGHKA